MKRVINVFISAGLIALFIYVADHTSRRPNLRATTVMADESQTKAAPQFELDTLDGRTVRLSDFRGKAVVLNFWATFCSPCKIETPWLAELYSNYKGQGLEIIGVSLDDGGRKTIEQFVKKMKVNYPVVIGNHFVADNYGGVRFIPQTFFIDRRGNIVNHTLGLGTKSDLENEIKQLLAIE